LVRNRDSIAGGDEWVNLMPPQVPALRPAVQQYQQWAIALDDRIERDPVGLDHFEMALLHCVFLSLRRR